MFQRFIGVFARPEHPLALFLDDLQWLDAATLDLLDDLLTRSELRHLLFIGAYRDNEVTAIHPLLRKLDVIKAAGGRIVEITLPPLASEHLTQLMTDALRCEAGYAVPLAELVGRKTGGNPFFVIQFLSSLAEEGLLTFDHDAGRWSWDLERIQAKGYTHNVIDLMAGKLTRLPDEARNALQQLACLGNVADVTTLSMVLGASTEQVDAALWPARRLELVERTAEQYRFAHDRVQEAAYSLIPEQLKGEAHLRIGRLLAAHTPLERKDDAIFDIVNQLNRGSALITSPDERAQLAEFNLLAGNRAKASAAHASALTYFVAGEALLPASWPESRHELGFALALHRAESEFLTGALTEADQRLAALTESARTRPELAAITRLRGELFVALYRIDRAVEVGLDYLRHVGIPCSAHPTNEEVQQEYARLRLRLGDRPIEELRDLPRMTDPEACGTMEVLLQIAPAALPNDENLLCLVACRMANISLEHGNSDRSSAYVWLGMVLGPYLGDYRSGFRFAQLGLGLGEEHGLERSRAYMLFGAHVSPWTQHVRLGRPMVQRAFAAANEVGDVTFAGYSCCNLVSNLLASGDALAGVQHEAEAGLDFTRQRQFGFVIDLMTPQLQLIRTLRGMTRSFGHLDDADFDEARFEERTADPIATCWYWIRKLQARFFAGSHAAAVAAAANARPLLWTSRSCYEAAEYHFYASLALAALCDEANDAERAAHLQACALHHRELQELAQNCPENFENRAALAGAEIARIEGRVLDAMNLYEQAIHSAQANGFVHNEALANELAARFYAGRGFEKIARTYLRDAKHCYLRWGADGKVRQLEQLYPYLQEAQHGSSSTSTALAAVENLDLATVIRVSQAISSEIVLDKLINMLMGTAIEHAGAERAVLLLTQGAEHRVEAEAKTSARGVIVRSRNEGASEAALPESIMRYVTRTRENVILDDAMADTTFAEDAYFREHHARSILCLPLTNQTKLIGMLYLENNLAPRVFTHARLAVLKLIASQAAISLENTRLYGDLEEREARIRRLVDSDIIGIVIWDSDGHLIDANNEFLRMVECDREDLAAGMHWFDMTPPEWQERVPRELEELAATGIMQPCEKEYYRKGGGRVPVLIGAAAFSGTSDQGVAYILDLTDQKRAEAAARENEQRYRDVQMELAHANRAATMGQLAGSIAHEVNQPITGTVTTAEAALRFLANRPPDLEEVRLALGQIVQDGMRAGEVIGRIRDMLKKAPPRQDLLEINGPIREVIELTHGEAMKNSVSVKTDLAEGLPLIRGDRVQLQQVMLNLIVNAVEAMSGLSDGVRELLVSTGITGSGDVLVAVRDSGPGLAPANRDRIFEAFYTTKTAGLGMGLSISRSIVEAHHGRLWASANELRGTTFQITLPASAETAAAADADQMQP